ncbi:MAG: cardiolipin synthase [Pasteurellaceae bacterium]|nr:cardiolipin synthase [Pasteurellaceae bacterium]
MTLGIILTYLIPILLWSLTVAITIRILTKNLSVSATLSWLMMIYLIPAIGIIAYLILGEIKLGKQHLSRAEKLKPHYVEWFGKVSQCPHLVHQNNDLKFSPIFDLVQKRLNIPCVVGNELHILDNPESIIHSIIHDINQAQYSINMVFYIWHNEGLIEQVSQALIAAHQRGVKVLILLDYVGSRPFLKSAICQQLCQAGIEIHDALHVNLFRIFISRIDVRQHRKIIVIDNQISYTGSMNMVDPKFFKQDSHVGEWVDIMVRINGPVSTIFNSLQAWDWEIETNQQLEVELPTCSPIALDKDNSHAVQILATGPGFPDDLMAQSLSIVIYSARKSISITSPYFVPSSNVAEALRVAALRGVEVSIILPRKNDSLMVGWASRTYFDELLSAGVNIYFFENGLLHTKSVLIDNQLALVGTVNMDIRSFMLNFEVTMLVEDQSFANEIDILHESYLAKAIPLNAQKWRNRPWYQRLIERLFFMFSPLL